jgi:hypothetical protein
MAQAIFFRRRHQPRRPPHATIRPGRPAPTTGPGTTTEPEAIVIVSTKKSHPLMSASGVVKVTEVIGSAAVDAREMLPNALVDELAAIPVN